VAKFNAVTSYKGLGKKPFEKKVYPSIMQRDITHIVKELDGELERCAGYDLAELAACHQYKVEINPLTALRDITSDALRWLR
jgi:hypothetical protein